MNEDTLIEEVLSSATDDGMDARPKVKLPGDGVALKDFAMRLAEILGDKGLYRRAGVPVIPFFEKACVEVMSVSAFRSWVERHVITFKTRKEHGGGFRDVVRSMPTETSEGVLSCWDFWPDLPEIDEVNPIRLPAWKDGKLALQAEGYDPDTRVLSFGKGCQLDETLTLDQATDHLRNLLAEFPFSDWSEPIERADQDGGGTIRQSRSQAVQVAAMLSQFTKDLLPRNQPRMGFIWNANAPRSGKTLLAKIAIVPVNGSVAVQSWNKKDEELKKVLDAEVLRAASYVFFDNVRGHMQSQVLESFMTSPNWAGRILGQTKMFTAPNLATAFFTGNDCTMSPDLAQRCLLCDLFVEEAAPRDRRRLKEVIDDAWLIDQENRTAIVSALWAIVRHWVEAGKPLATVGLRTGYEKWCEMIGGMVAFAGFGDCLAEPSNEGGGDTESNDMRALVTCLLANDLDGVMKRQEFTFQWIVNTCHAEGFFDWLLDGKEEGGDYILKPKAASRFGKLLRRYAPTQGYRVFRLPEGKVGMSVTGKNRARRYNIDRLS